MALPVPSSRHELLQKPAAQQGQHQTRGRMPASEGLTTALPPKGDLVRPKKVASIPLLDDKVLLVCVST